MKSRCTKHSILGALLEVELFSKCTRLLREAHSAECRNTFGRWAVQKMRSVVVRSTFRSQESWNWQSRTTFGSCDVKKVQVAVARHIYNSNVLKNWRSRTTFWTCVCACHDSKGVLHFAIEQKVVCSCKYITIPATTIVQIQTATALGFNHVALHYARLHCTTTTPATAAH